MENPRYEEKLGELPSLSALPQLDSSSAQTKEKIESDSVTDEKHSLDAQVLDEDKPEYRNGEPIITTGLDVSRFAVDLRDDGDEALTFRSICLGTLFAGMGAALCQVRDYCFSYFCDANPQRLKKINLCPEGL